MRPTKPNDELYSQIWEEVICEPRKHSNMGFYASCCSTYIPRNRDKIEEHHAKVIRISVLLRKNKIKTKQDLIRYHQANFTAGRTLSIGTSFCSFGSTNQLRTPDTLLLESLKAKLRERLHVLKETLCQTALLEARGGPVTCEDCIKDNCELDTHFSQLLKSYGIN